MNILRKTPKLVTGFTLIETIVVVIVIAILAGFAAPRYMNTVEKSKAAEGVSILTALLSAQRRYNLEHAHIAGMDTYATDIADLDIDFPATPRDFSMPEAMYLCVDNGCATCTVGTIDKSTGPQYTLSICEDGTIICSPSGAGTWCHKIGY